MNDIVLTGGVGLATSVISSIVTWLLAVRKYNSEVDNKLIENMKESLEFYKTLSNDNKERLEEAVKRADRLEDEVATLRGEIFGLMSQICLNFSCTMRQAHTPLFGEQTKSSKYGTSSKKNP